MVLEDLAGAAAASINELARKAGVSEASVTRFAKAIGCRDVRDLKLRLAQATAVGARFLQPGGAGAAAEAPATLADSIHADILTALEVNRGLMDAQRIEDAARLLLGARMVYAFGMGGGSSFMADVLLPVRTLETDFIFKPSASRYAMLMVLDVLATQCALLQQDQSKERLRRLKLVLDSHRGETGPSLGPDSRQPLGD
ncbi:Helix-turn-helix domain, rpiR family [compost metagenome]